MPPTRVTPEQYDAVLFDLDGVLTATANVHAAAWKRTFDEFLRRRARESGAGFTPFDIGSDYVRYVDGLLRQDGVRTFLASRNIELPEGEPGDSPDLDTVHGIGNRKTERFLEVLATDGVDLYEDAVAWARQVRAAGLKTAVVSASKNCAAALRAARIEDLFDLRVDGLVAARLGLAGKPAPDTFLEAAKELGVEPRRAVVVEDAISGVQAGRAGDFGLVVGVARKGNAEQLAENGADVVVTDLRELAP
ncbi:MAG: beta-phosphoglucomutase family hydrolase [Candidatus Latescibacterota bacterium]|nr:MAG: beta-phosphoglucomutase family hydrolase [Candidatus Latescibacterota bacterium]